MNKVLIALAVALALAVGIAAVSVVTSLLIELAECSDANVCYGDGYEEGLSSHHAGTQRQLSRRPALNVLRKTQQGERQR